MKLKTALAGLPRSALGAIGHRIATECVHRAEPGDTTRKFHSRRGTCLTDDDNGKPEVVRQNEQYGVFRGRDLFLMVDGTLMELRYDGGWSCWTDGIDRWETAERTLTAAQVAGSYDVPSLLENLSKRLAKASETSDVAGIKAKVAKLQAAVSLLKEAAQ